MDLAAEWRGRRWRKLLNIIDRLPRDSAYVEAISEDDALADAMISSEQPTDQPVRRLSDWSAEVELLTALVDRVSELIQVIVAVNGAKPSAPPTAPRPVTAFDRARDRARQRRHQSLVARVLPHKAKPPE